jgi:hypothetical protein
MAGRYIHWVWFYVILRHITNNMNLRIVIDNLCMMYMYYLFELYNLIIGLLIVIIELKYKFVIVIGIWHWYTWFHTQT